MKSLSAYLILFLVCSCGQGPEVTTYIHDHSAGGFQFSDRTGTSQGTKLYDDPIVESLICYTPNDLQLLLDWAHGHAGAGKAQFLGAIFDLKKSLETVK